MRGLRRRYGRATGALHERIAQALGWPLRDVQSFSLHALRDLVRPVSPKLAHEITAVISSGRYVT